MYTPLIYEWCRRRQINETDAADITQEVLQAVNAKILTFRREEDGDTFHGWLWGITRFKILDFFRDQTKEPAPVGGSSAHMMLQNLQEQLPTAQSDQEQQEDVQQVSCQVLRLLRTDFEERTWKAFWRVVVDEVPAGSVAEELSMTPGAVYNAKYKVMRRLREELDGLIT